MDRPNLKQVSIVKAYATVPQLDYRTIADMSGPLVILDNIKLSKHADIVNLRLGDGTTRSGQVLEVNESRSVV